jgi:hypothetical protein
MPERSRLTGDNATTANSGQRDPREKPFFDSLNKRLQPTPDSVRCAPPLGRG